MTEVERFAAEDLEEAILNDLLEKGVILTAEDIMEFTWLYSEEELSELLDRYGTIGKSKFAKVHARKIMNINKQKLNSMAPVN